jgi:RNA polymerase sigma-70 factor (ECF subfamily)
MDEGRTIDAARDGDAAAFEVLVAPHRPELRAHCYRMLASLPDADDAVQDTLLRAWRGLARFEGRSSLRSWLYTIATNVCLRAAERRPPRTVPLDVADPAAIGEEPGRPLVESVWIEPYPDELLGPEASVEQRESVELAFVAAVQLLPASQRAALLLRQVLGFSAAETAATLGTTVAAVNSALQRARARLDERLPERSQQASLRALGDAAVRDLVGRYTAAMASGDVEAVVALITEDATWSMPPCQTWYGGLAAVRVFLRDYPLANRWRHLPTRTNGQPAALCYMLDEDAGAFRLHAIDVLTVAGSRIAAVTAFLDPAVFPRFGAPLELPAR